MQEKSLRDSESEPQWVSTQTEGEQTNSKQKDHILQSNPEPYCCEVQLCCPFYRYNPKMYTDIIELQYKYTKNKYYLSIVPNLKCTAAHGKNKTLTQKQICTQPFI